MQLKILNKYGIKFYRNLKNKLRKRSCNLYYWLGYVGLELFKSFKKKILI